MYRVGQQETQVPGVYGPNTQGLLHPDPVLSPQVTSRGQVLAVAQLGPGRAQAEQPADLNTATQAQARNPGQEPATSPQVSLFRTSIKCYH